MYEPGDDSYLMEKYVRNFASGRVLEIGCGSGILMKAALTKTENVIGVDIDNEALEFCRKQGLNVKKSDLFSNVEGRFDLIIFNPPYLPEDGPFLERNVRERKNIDIIGGKHGWEIIERFLINVKSYLNKNGRILIIFSSLTNKKKVDSISKENNYKFKCLETKKMFFEELYVYLIKMH